MLRTTSQSSKRLSTPLFYYSSSSSHGSTRTLTTAAATFLHCWLDRSKPSIFHARAGLFSSLWSATQLRFARFSGADVRPGNVIQRKGKMYEVIKAQHTTQGRGGAIIQVELRDIDSGNKLNERLRTDEAVERVYVEEKSFTYLYADDESESIVLMEPETYDQVDVPKHMFGESLPYLTDDMKVTVQFFDGKPTSAKVPQRVTCTVAEAQVPIKGSTAQPQYKKVLLENGLTVQVPSYILAGERLVINTTDHSYMSRA